MSLSKPSSSRTSSSQPLALRHQPSDPQLPLHASAQRNQRALAKRRAHSHSKASKNMALEVGAMMGVNLFVAAIALVTIIKLIPHNATQQEQLQALEAEVTALDERVNALRREFVQYFDPQQAQVNKRQLSDRLNAGQRKIILTPPQTHPQTVDDIDDASSNSIDQ